MEGREEEYQYGIGKEEKRVSNFTSWCRSNSLVNQWSKPSMIFCSNRSCNCSSRVKRCEMKIIIFRSESMNPIQNFKSESMIRYFRTIQPTHSFYFSTYLLLISMKKKFSAITEQLAFQDLIKLWAKYWSNVRQYATEQA